MHATGPETILYLPSANAVHGPPSGPLYPALHEQSARVSLPAGELESD